MVATAESVAASITEMVWALVLATYMRVPAGLNATPVGPLPTLAVPTRERVAVSNTATVLPGLTPPVSATATRVPAGFTATPKGPGSAGIVPTTALVETLTT